MFLGYSREESGLIAALEAAGCSVEHTSDPVRDVSAYDLVVSYGFRHIIRQPVIDTARRPILNLHIAYLPWNRGAHPLFWAAYEGAPTGVTIHEIDAGVDTGRICFQQQVPIDYATTTFAEGYAILRSAIEAMFVANLEAILDGGYTPVPQEGEGSCRFVRELPGGFAWSENISQAINRLRSDPPAQAAVERP